MLEWIQLNGILVVCGLVLLIGGLAVTALACCHFYLILHGLTTWEHVSHSRVFFIIFCQDSIVSENFVSGRLFHFTIPKL